MADKNVFGVVEDGTYSTAAPNPHINLAGTMPSDAKIKQLFDTVLDSTDTVTVTVWKDATNWAVYDGVEFTSGAPDELDLNGGTLRESEGSISDTDSVEVWGLEPYFRVKQKAEAPVGSNITAEVNTHHVCDLSGLSANRSIVLPAPAVGDIIRVSISVTDADYELIVEGDTGISINGGATATEYCRLCPLGDTIAFEATSTTNYQVIGDDRIKVVASRKSDGTGANQTASGSTDMQLTDTGALSGSVTDDYSLWNSADDEFVLPVSGKWQVSGLIITTPHASSDQDRCRAYAYLNDTTKLMLWRGVSSGNSTTGGGGGYTGEFSKGDTLGCWFTQYDADNWTVADSATNSQLFSVERLK